MKEKQNSLTPLSQKLRKTMTKEEKHLWYDFLKKLPVTVNRQKVIGRYIVDFYCEAARLAIEVDGSQHYSKEGREYDGERDLFLNHRGITVLRYTNSAINADFEGVCIDINKHLKERIRQTDSL